MSDSGGFAGSVRAGCAWTPRLTSLVTAFAAGVWLASALPGIGARAWLLLTGVALTAVVVVIRRPGTARWLLVAASLGLGATRLALVERHGPAGDLATASGDLPRLVRLRGAALASSERVPGAVGAMAAYLHRPDVLRFPLRARARIDDAGRETPVRGIVDVRVPWPAPAVRPGDVVVVSGMLVPPRGPQNPGGYDGVAAARRRGNVGMVFVPDGALLRQTGAIDDTPALHWARRRAGLRERAERGLLRGVPWALDDSRVALLRAIFLGRRTGAGGDVQGAFRRVGVGHLLAISGLHIGILAGLVLLAARVTGVPRVAHAWLVAVTVVSYVVLVETRMPVLRAGLMITAACLGTLAGRRLDIRGLIALSAGVLLFRWPHQLFDVGFQLSYAVVLGLIVLAPGVRRRCFGPPDREAASVPAMLTEGAKTACTVAMVAWLVACPLTLHHFGFASPLGGLLSVALVPGVALLLAIGYLKIALSLAAPVLATILAGPLGVGVTVLVKIVCLVDRAPGSMVAVPPPGVAWTIITSVWVWLLLSARPRAARWHVCAATLLIAWLVAPALPYRGGPALRLDMIAVGNGSCYLLRADGRAILFDAGSGSRADGGARTIVGALRAWKVSRLDAVVISHGNLDHYAAVPALVEAMPVGEVLVTPHLLRAGAADVAGPVVRMLEILDARGVPVRAVGQGHERCFGTARWTWLHPPPARRFRRSNDTSMIVRIEAAGRSVLLTGDSEAEAIAELLGGAAPIEADVLELPHHGARTAAAVALVRRARPSIVLQSAGWSRWRHDEWGDDLGDARRLVTARDGACSVTVHPSGAIRVETFVTRRDRPPRPPGR